MKKAVVAITQEVEVVATPTQKEVNQDQPHPNKEPPKDQTQLLEVLPEDTSEIERSAVQMEDLETAVQVVAVILAIVLKEVARVKLNEATESIDILKNRQFQ